MLHRTPAFLAILAMSSVSVAADQQPSAQKPAAPRAQAQREANQAEEARDAQTESPAATGAQRQLQDAQQRTSNFRGGQQGDESLDSAVADCLILSNKEEIALLKYGMQKTQNDQVKQAAQKMIQDHEKAVQSLTKFANRARNVEFQAGTTAGDQSLATTREARRIGTEQNSTETADSATAPQTAARNETAGRNEIADNTNRDNGANRDNSNRSETAGKGDIGAQMFDIERQAHENCLKMVEEDLNKHEGHHFDAAFLGYQTGMHVGMLAKLKAIEGHVSGELQQVVQNAAQVTEQHKEHVEQLMEQVAHNDKGHGDKAGAENPNAPKTGAGARNSTR